MRKGEGAMKIGGGKGPDEKDQVVYEKQYWEGADLAEKAFKSLTHPNSPYQKEEFEQVMTEAMMVLNQTARQLKQKPLIDQNEQLQHDYDAYLKDPSEKKKEKVIHDLEGAKRLIDQKK